MAEVSNRQAGPDVPEGGALDRIARAVARIETAAAARANDNHALSRRHETLRSRMAEAIVALDEIIARGDMAVPGDD